MKSLNDSELLGVHGGMPSQETNLAYDLAFGLAGLASTLWSSFRSPLPARWHSGMVGGAWI